MLKSIGFFMPIIKYTEYSYRQEKPNKRIFEQNNPSF